LVRPKDIGQLAGCAQLSLQGNLQDRSTFGRLPDQPIGFFSQAVLSGSNLPR
jgi:hypothetical protein